MIFPIALSLMLGAVTPTVMVGIHANADGLCSDYSQITACENDLTARESEIGKQLALDSQYGPWDFVSLPEAEWTVQSGRFPMYTWQHVIGNNGCIFWQDVVNGVYDTQLTAQANYLAAHFPNGIILRLLPEMNKAHQACLYDVDPVADPVTAGSEFQQLWQHVYSVVHPIAGNVLFDFSPGADAFSNGDVVTVWQDFYPGADYTDLVGSQIYNSGSLTAVSVVNSSVFNDWYVQAAALGKPLILSETGAVENPTANRDPQQKWFASMGSNFATLYPAIKYLVVFDVNANSDYRLGGAGETAFINLVGRKYFQRTAP